MIMGSAVAEAHHHDKTQLKELSAKAALPPHPLVTMHQNSLPAAVAPWIWPPASRVGVPLLVQASPYR
jgi:hypothetical protein